MTTYTKLTAKQNMVMMDFMAVAKTNGVQILFACVPASSELFKTNKVRQIRVVTDAIAWLHTAQVRTGSPQAQMASAAMPRLQKKAISPPEK
jgi:hypothetical protein